AVGCGRIASDGNRRRCAGRPRQLLPELFGDEGHERMQRSQRHLQHVSEGGARLGLLRVRAAREDRLAELEVPVAELVPEKVVERLRTVVETELFDALVRGLDRAR